MSEETHPPVEQKVAEAEALADDAVEKAEEAKAAAAAAAAAEVAFFACCCASLRAALRAAVSDFDSARTLSSLASRLSTCLPVLVM